MSLSPFHHRVLMDSLVLRERLETMVLREILVPLALLDPLVPLDLRFADVYTIPHCTPLKYENPIIYSEHQMSR